MPLESATHISDLVTTNPDGSVDTKASLDDHIRMLKTVLKTDFPNITGPVTPTQTNLNKVGVTQAQSSNDTSVASTAYVRTAVAAAAMSSTTPTVSGDAGKAWVSDGSIGAWTAVVNSFNGATGDVLESISRSARTSNTVLGTADRGKLIDITSGTFSQTFAAAATLTAGWYCYIRNSGTGDVTLEPDGSEQIDGLTNFVMYPGEVRLVQCDGSALRTVMLKPGQRTYTASGTFTVPPGVSGLLVDVIGGGGGGGSGARGADGEIRVGGGGGGGGARVMKTLLPFAAGTAVTVTVGAAGAVGAGVLVSTTVGNSGTAGGTSSFGAYALAYGGGGGAGGDRGGGPIAAPGGGGGGSAGAGQTPTAGVTTAVTGGLPSSVNFGANNSGNHDNVGGGGAGNGGSTGYSAEWGGGSGGGGQSSGSTGTPGGGSVHGAAGGGAAGGLTAANAASDGGAGGNIASYTNSGGGAGGTAGVAGTAGADSTTDCGTGGGGAGSHASNAGAAGGAGGAPGGGGGGGAPSVNGVASGAGGAGGRGEVRVFWW